MTTFRKNKRMWSFSVVGHFIVTNVVSEFFCLSITKFHSISNIVCMTNFRYILNTMDKEFWLLFKHYITNVSYMTYELRILCYFSVLEILNFTDYFFRLKSNQIKNTLFVRRPTTRLIHTYIYCFLNNYFKYNTYTWCPCYIWKM